MHHLARRSPQKTTGFAWGRFFDEENGTVEYRLFRRDLNGRLHYETRRYFVNEPRSHIARHVRRACRMLRDRVDEIDIRILDAEPAANPAENFQ